MDGIGSGSDKPGGPERPRPEDSTEAIRRLHSNLLAAILEHATQASVHLEKDLGGAVGSSKEQREIFKKWKVEKWPIIESLARNVEHTVADRLAQIAVVALREVLYKTPPPTPDDIVAHMMNRLAEEVARLKPEPEKQ